MDAAGPLPACAGVSEAIALSSERGFSLMAELPRQRLYYISTFSSVEKTTSLAIPALWNQRRGLRKAKKNGRRRLAGLRARCKRARGSPGRAVVVRRELRGCHGDQETQGPGGNNRQGLFHH